MVRKSKLILALEVLLILIIALYFVDAYKNKKTVSNRICLGTSCTVTVYGNPKRAKEAIELMWDKITELENQISVNLPYSQISAVNESAGSQKWVEVSQQVYDMVDFALQMEEKTQGALNVALGSVIELWGIGTEHARVPEDYEIKEALKACKTENIETKHENGHFYIRITEEDTRLNLGAVGKGWAADLACDVLQEQGIKMAIIDFGGNILVMGKKTFTVGLQDPQGERGQTFMDVKVQNKSVVTSGSYERFVTGADSKVYSHVIDPSTGWSIENNIASVSIVGPYSAICDALSTAFFILGPEKAIETLQNGLEAYTAYFLLSGEAGKEAGSVVKVGSEGFLE